MGRPLNDKYFGNRNVGVANVSSDDKIGGEGIDSITLGSGLGHFVVNDTYRNFPQLSIPAPDIPGGVQATADVVFEIDTVAYSSGGQTIPDYVTGLSTSITGLGGGAVVHIVETAGKVTSVDLVGGNRGEFRRGDFTGANTNTFQVLQAGHPGTDLQISVTFRLKSINVTQPGSGYTPTQTLSWTGHDFTTQTAPDVPTPVLHVDVGQNNASKNPVGDNQNAIIIHANTTGAGTKIGDIIKQEASRRYKVKTNDGIKVCKLVNNATPAIGEAYIQATATGGNTYFVMKLTAHKALLKTKSGNGALDGQRVHWSFDAPSSTSVQIENA